MTILFVSHDPSAIRALCSRAVLLHAGCVEAIASRQMFSTVTEIGSWRARDAYEAGQRQAKKASTLLPRTPAPRRPLTFYRHGDRSAEILR